MKLDENGNFIDSISYHSNGLINWHQARKFNSQSQIIENIIYFQSNGSEFISSQEIYEYDSKRRIVKYEKKHPITQIGDKYCSIQYKDNKENLTERKIEECNGRKNEINFKYNKNRDLIEEIYSTYTIRYRHSYHKNGNLGYTLSTGGGGSKEWFYDEKGRLIEHTQSGHNNWVYSYDENGNKSKITINPLVSSIITLYETELIYNNNNQIISKLEKSGNPGIIDNLKIYKYSDTGLLNLILEFKTLDTNSEPKGITRYEYQ